MSIRPGREGQPPRAAPAGRYAPLRCSTGLTVSSRQRARARGMAAITATSTSNPVPPPHLTFGPSRLMSVPPPVLRPLLTSARSAPTSRSEPSARRQRQHNRHPGRPPRIRTTNFPLRPPRLPDDPVDGDGLYLLEQAHPDRPAFYAVRVPRCRDSPRASFPPRLTATQLPPARSQHHLFLQGTFTPNRSPMPGVLKSAPCGRVACDRLRRLRTRLWVPVTVSHGLICGFAGTGA
jgi:hypothetical protein